MSLAVVYSRAVVGMQALPVTIETHLSNGLPKLSIVGLPETAVKESRDRVRSAILNSGFEFPVRNITVNLAPADLPKEGGQFDLAIALSILAASEQIPALPLETYEWLGELSLGGTLRPVKGVLPSAMACALNQRHLFVPAQNALEAAMVSALPVFSATHLTTVVQHLKTAALEPHPPTVLSADLALYPDLLDVRGQQLAKRALEIAAAGSHSLLMVGPPGTGKSMLASRLPGILPPLTHTAALEVACLNSITQGHRAGYTPTLSHRPFRTPHHSASAAALVGGGRYPKPGEISLAHQGVLFLDEFPEFEKRVLESLREPLESGVVTVSRAQQQLTFPARFQLIAAMNPCPCGYLTHPEKSCRCSAEQVARYRHKISGPILDRIDLHIEVPYLPAQQLTQTTNLSESSALVRARVCQARERQEHRQATANAYLSTQAFNQHCAISDAFQEKILRYIEKLHLSARAYHRVLKVARTIADLADSSEITLDHALEALSLRLLDKGTP